MKIGQKIALIITTLLLVSNITTILLDSRLAVTRIKNLTSTSIDENLEMFKTVMDMKLSSELDSGESIAQNLEIVSLLEAQQGMSQFNELPKMEQTPEEGKEHPLMPQLSADINEERVVEELQLEVSKREILDDIGIVDLSGEIVLAANSSAIGLDIVEREYFQKVMETGEAYIGSAIVSKDTGSVVIPVSNPIKNRQGELLGMVMSMIRSDMVAQEINGISLLETQNTYPILIDQGGIILAHKSEDLIGQKQNIEQLNGPLDAIEEVRKNKVNQEVVFTSPTDGSIRHLEYMALNQADWLVAITYDPAEMLAVVNDFKRMGMINLILTLLVVQVVVYFATRSISRPIGAVTELIKKLSELDLREVQDDLKVSKDEVGQMKVATTSTSEALRDIVAQLVSYSGQLNHSALEMKTASKEMAEDASSTSVVVEQLSASMQEINASTEEVNSTVESINDNIREITKYIAASGQVALSIAEKAEGIKTGTKLHSEKTLDEYSHVKQDMELALKKAEVVSKINLLVDSIKGITEQTNLLALNASIEAARAGELGKGFGVVAHEIGTLALQSGEAVQEIQKVITEVLEATQEMKQTAEFSLEFMEKQIHENLNSTTTHAEQYINDANEVYGMLQGLEQKAEELNQYSEIITVSINGVAEAISQNVEGVVDIAGRTTNINDKTAEIEAMSVENERMANELDVLTQQFKL